MTHSDEKEPKSASQRIIENALKGPFLPDEEIAKNEAASEQLEGTSREVAFISDDGTISASYFGQNDYVSGREYNPPLLIKSREDRECLEERTNCLQDTRKHIFLINPTAKRLGT